MSLTQSLIEVTKKMKTITRKGLTAIQVRIILMQSNLRKYWRLFLKMIKKLPLKSLQRKALKKLFQKKTRKVKLQTNKKLRMKKLNYNQQLQRKNRKIQKSKKKKNSQTSMILTTISLSKINPRLTAIHSPYHIRRIQHPRMLSMINKLKLFNQLKLSLSKINSLTNLKAFLTILCHFRKTP